MKEYKVLKIWYLKANNEAEALKDTNGIKPDFVNVNSHFKHDTRK